jgi:hypothetical protein|tara:strand:- start:1127 stop:1489 length:363 start_codon:yes stop_codon:yes gene_type:complete
MSTNIKVATNTSINGDVKTVFKYVDSNITVGEDGTGNNRPTTTRIIAIHTYSTLAGGIEISGTKQITNKTAKGSAIRYRVGALDSNDMYIGELGVPVHGVVSCSTSGTAAMLPHITLYVG